MRALANVFGVGLLLVACGDDGAGGSGGVAPGGGGAATDGGSGAVGGQAGAPSGGSGAVGGEGGEAGAGGGPPECRTAGECPQPPTQCVTATCDDGVCGLANLRAGTPLMDDVLGDCLAPVCDGNGSVTVGNSDTDVLDDANDCTVDLCEAGLPAYDDAPADTACDDAGGVVCDGAGACVECTGPGDCTAPETCIGGTCAIPGCANGVQDPGEADVDCGGTCATPCSAGSSCSLDTDCSSAMCHAAECVTSVNGCTVASAQDLTAMSATTVTFDNGNLSYAPKCIKVAVGTSVTFDGPFAGHPLLGGTVVGGTVTPDATGPFVPVTNTSTSKTFVMTAPGTFPYFCVPHATLGMNGAVFVVP
jgi:plastocyanin